MSSGCAVVFLVWVTLSGRWSRVALVTTARAPWDVRQPGSGRPVSLHRLPPRPSLQQRCALRSRNHHQYKGEAARPRHQSTTANRRRHHEDSRVPVCGAGCGVRGSGCAWSSAPTTSWPSADPCCAEGGTAWQRAGLLRILPIRCWLSAMTMANGFQIGITVEFIQTPFG
ncbi:uncharacterized protein LOC124789158 [Schistocerca piceifrons]|uniref:uncharacterized protein LOC124789158 n=1 Tax=Schistocerca piceifrons TaxID=274613 RepID=UPI001F5F1A93|nr:uncharacterized protein LOC124789158 [Schistocerca piceifrons]